MFEIDKIKKKKKNILACAVYILVRNLCVGSRKPKG